jgi:hypothetical protein
VLALSPFLFSEVLRLAQEAITFFAAKWWFAQPSLPGDRDFQRVLSSLCIARLRVIH